MSPAISDATRPAPHLVIAGLGPAGAVLALRARDRGWAVSAFDPAVTVPGRLPEWTATYGALWEDVPAWGRPLMRPPHPVTVRCGEGVAGPDSAAGQATGLSYTMLNKDALRRAVEASGVEIVPGVAPSSGTHGTVVVDATGAPVTGREFWQVAVGLVLPYEELPDLPAPEFMNWQRPCASPPSFLYVQHVEDGVLFEETVLATHTPPQDLFGELEARLVRRLSETFPHLQQRLASTPVSAALERGPVSSSGHAPSPIAKAPLRRELVAIPMGTRRAGSRARGLKRSPNKGPIYFGAAGGLINPATGYSVSAAMSAADSFLDDIARRHGCGDGSAVASENKDGSWRNTLVHAHRVANAELARWLRRLGAELICRADHETLRSFFSAFFALPAERQRDYLTGHDGLAVARTMWALRRRTGLRHPFLRPLWTEPLSVLARACEYGSARPKTRGSAAARGLPR